MDLAFHIDGFTEFMWGISKNEIGDLSSNNTEYPLIRDLMIMTPAAVAVLMVVKTILERLVFLPIFKSVVVNQPRNLPFKSNELEQMYLESKPVLPDINKVKAVSKTISKTVEEINNWLRFRQRADRDNVKIRVCCNTAWRLVIYSLCVAANMRIMREDGITPANTWSDMPLQKSSQHLKYFYVALELPNYIMLLVHQLTENRKASDSWEMSTHHMLVVALIVLIYSGNFLRIGLFGLLLHDTTDIFLEGSKLASYLRLRRLADLLFTGFAFSWGYARLYSFSITVVPSIFENGRRVSGDSFYLIAAMIGILYFLNLYWFYKIAKLWYRLFWAGTNKEKQQRDLTDLSTDDEPDSDSSFFSDGSTMKQHED